ncbi:MAG: hypothetical protein ABWY71_02990 [Candidatus Saccharimonadales bacterium]
MTDDIHDLLQRQRVTPRRPLSNNFTNDILKRIGDTPHRPSLAERLHLPIPEIRMRLLHLPKAALVALAIVAAGTSTAAAYGAYSWLIPRIDILGIVANNDDNKREFVVDVKDCGVMYGGETANNGSQRYEVSPDAHLTDEQVIKVLKNSCDYQQILQMMNTRWKGDSQIVGRNPGDAIDMTSAGANGTNIINDPWLGKVTALDATHITIDSVVYQQYNGKNTYLPGDPVPDPSTQTEYYPKGKTISRTFEIKPDMDVILDGQTVPRDQLKVGDKIVFMSQAKGTIGADHMWNITSLQVAHVIKTHIDPAYVQPMWVGDPAIINAIARLERCQGNGDYLCIAGKSMQLQFKMAYSYTSQLEIFTPGQDFSGNEKYFRTDINPRTNEGNKFYHSIEGRITSIDGNRLTLQSRGKIEKFNVTLPYDVAGQFNKTQKQKIAKGTYIQISYFLKNGEDPHDIKSGDIQALSLLLRQLGDGSLAKY